MEASDLHRKLIYNGHDDLTDYLRNSPLNRYIYKQLLELKSDRSLDHSILTIFNEVYYQCVRVQIDATPGEDLSFRYLDEEEKRLKSRNASYLVFCLVWIILSLKKEQNFHEECFLENLSPLLSYFSYEEFAKNHLNCLQEQNIEAPDKFETIPSPVEDLPYFDGSDPVSWFIIKVFPSSLTEDERREKENNPWRHVTNGFSPKYIEYYVNLYTSPDDRHTVMWHIREACNGRERRALKGFFNELEERIDKERQLSSEKPAGQETANEKDDSSNVSQQKVISQLEQKLQDQRADYDLQLARMAAKYKQHINQLEKRQDTTARSDMAHEKPIPEGNATTSEPSFTIAEMTAHVKERFSKQAAEEFCTMYYHLATSEGHHLDEASSKLVDGIVPAILLRDRPHQTIEMPNVKQFNNNPQTVINHGDKD